MTLGQVNGPLYYKSIGEKMKGASFGRKPFETLKHRVRGRIDTRSRNIATSDPSPCRQGQFRS